MGCVIQLMGDRHEQVSLLLPWYVAERLESAEHAAVEAHLANCKSCQSDLKFERRIDREIADASLSADQGWVRFSERLVPPSRTGFAPGRLTGRLAGAFAPAGLAAATNGMHVKWSQALAGVLALQVTVLAGILWLAVPFNRPAEYRVMGNGAARGGDAIVMFREDITEQQMRGFLTASRARIVDGPTSTNAYILKFDDSGMARGIRLLKAQPQVVMAEPLAGKTQ